MKKILDKKVIITSLLFIVVLVAIWVTGENRINSIIQKKKPSVTPAVVTDTNFNIKTLRVQ